VYSVLYVQLCALSSSKRVRLPAVPASYKAIVHPRPPPRPSIALSSEVPLAVHFFISWHPGSLSERAVVGDEYASETECKGIGLNTCSDMDAGMDEHGEVG
jgi:hypothetical protein